MLITTPAPGGDAVHARLATLMLITTPAPGGDAVHARLATLMPLTPASKRDVGGSVYRSEVYGRRLYLVQITRHISFFRRLTGIRASFLGSRVKKYLKCLF